mmetsp:Transcript_109422/g.315144  ORF Transcript_109422/g.315144 Transcript_109422/m.315144 type:complete len:215 (-) Transcript_109422:1069-1713(-)
MGGKANGGNGAIVGNGGGGGKVGGLGIMKKPSSRVRSLLRAASANFASRSARFASCSAALNLRSASAKSRAAWCRASCSAARYASSIRPCTCSSSFAAASLSSVPLTPLTNNSASARARSSRFKRFGGWLLEGASWWLEWRSFSSSRSEGKATSPLALKCVSANVGHTTKERSGGTLASSSSSGVGAPRSSSACVILDLSKRRSTRSLLAGFTM